MEAFSDRWNVFTTALGSRRYAVADIAKLAVVVATAGYAEVDVIAEGKRLLFSRWIFQCKALKSTGKISVEDVAREVGIATHSNAHVIAMVSTGGFTATAYTFAEEMTAATHLQFLFLDGQIVRQYLSEGPSKLIEDVLKNAAVVMQTKRGQLISTLTLKPTEGGEA